MFSLQTLLDSESSPRKVNNRSPQTHLLSTFYKSENAVGGG